MVINDLWRRQDQLNHIAFASPLRASVTIATALVTVALIILLRHQPLSVAIFLAAGGHLVHRGLAIRWERLDQQNPPPPVASA